MARIRSPHLRTSVACAVIAAEVVAGVVALVVVSTGSSSDAAGSRPSVTRSVGAPGSTSSSTSPSTSTTSSSPAVGAQTSRLVAWARRALPLDSPVLADPEVATALRAAGFTDIRPTSSVDGARFVFDTPALRSAAAQDAALAGVLAGSVPVAQGGSGDGAVLVRQVSDITPRQLATEARTRRSAEGELLGNGNLRASAQSRRVLAAGALDLRAAAVLALLASTDPVQVVAIQVDPLEQAAGRPARVVDLRTGSVDALRSMLAAVAAGYRLGSITTVADGVQRLTWPVDVTSGGNS